MPAASNPSLPDIAAHDFAGPLTRRIVAFLREIGIAVEPGVLDGATFVPGIEIRGGTLLVDESRLVPGDLLHEAGHIAVTPPELRAELGGNVLPQVSDEMGAIAWSWAALVHLGLDPAVVFHPRAYRGDAPALIENFSRGYYFGVPILQLRGIALEPRIAAETGRPAFPTVLRWLA